MTFLGNEEILSDPMRIQFSTCSKASENNYYSTPYQNRNGQYYDGLIHAMEYLDSSSFTVAKQKT